MNETSRHSASHHQNSINENIVDIAHTRLDAYSDLYSHWCLYLYSQSFMKSDDIDTSTSIYYV